uniref:Uncharacterized protein n=1 Tax=Anguilla anguilla TaxID=7936 RepID=A0A0E9TAW0_ANGAN
MGQGRAGKDTRRARGCTAARQEVARRRGHQEQGSSAGRVFQQGIRLWSLHVSGVFQRFANSFAQRTALKRTHTSCSRGLNWQLIERNHKKLQEGACTEWEGYRVNWICT